MTPEICPFCNDDIGPLGDVNHVSEYTEAHIARTRCGRTQGVFATSVQRMANSHVREHSGQPSMEG